MTKRLILGPVMIALLIAGLALDQWLDRHAVPAWLRWTGAETFPPGVVVFCILGALTVVAARELASLLEAERIEGSKRALTTAAVVGLLVSCLVPAALPAPVAVGVVSTASVAVLVLAMAFYSRHRSVEGVIAATGGVLLSYVYLGLMAGFILAIRREHSVWVLGWLLLATKACDIGAYFTGVAVGRHKLIPWLSPGKTWEGLAGGVLLSGVVGAAGLAWLRQHELSPGPPLWQGFVLGALLGVTGQVGDLLESILKRDAGKKDSGKGIPGFGGVLDVLDSLLLAMPVAFWWLFAMRATHMITQS